MTAAIVETIPEVLSWKDDAESLRKLNRDFGDTRVRSFSGWLEKSACGLHSEAVRKLASRIQGLPEPSLERFLKAPQTWRTFFSVGTQPVEKQIAFLDESIRAELLLLGEEPDQEGSSWTALGDYCFWHDSSPPRSDTGLRRYSALRVGKHLFLDAISPYSRISVNPKRGNLAAYSQEDLPGLALTFQSVLEKLATVPRAQDLVVSSLESIVVKKCPKYPTRISTSSWRNLIGKTGFINPHVATEADLANNLVHEAIHSFLYRVEAWHPFYRQTAEVEKVRVKSPWTGNLLPLHSYLHACFVWFGLWNFWRLLPEGTGFTLEDVETHRTRAKRGFSVRSLVQPCQPLEGVISRECWQVLDRLQSRVT